MFDNIRQHETKTLGIIWAGNVSRHSSQSHRLSNNQMKTSNSVWHTQSAS